MVCLTQFFQQMKNSNMQLTSFDNAFYEERLKDFLPTRIVDLHAHIWQKSFEIPRLNLERGAQWASKVASENSIEELLADYSILLPGQQVTPLLFGWPERYIDVGANNCWVSVQAKQYHLPTLFVSKPDIPPEELEAQVMKGGFLGLKPYLEFAPVHLTADQISIFDFLPKAHLEVANAYHWIVMLHLPRSGRLHDPENLTQMLEIERNYPNIQLVIAHLGRAYCMQDIGNALEILRHTDCMLFEFSANTNSEVMLQFIRVFGSKRLVFGSDMPITRMRMRRICENGTYVNLVPPNLYGELHNEPHMREISLADAEQLTFFLYEELLAFGRAAELSGLTGTDMENIFYNNAQRLFQNLTEG